MSEIKRPSDCELGELCGHDVLRRSCDACWAEYEIATLRAKLERFKAAGLADENGEPRKVLGKLPLTKDGAIIGDDCKVWFEGEYVNVEPFRSSVSGESDWHPFLCGKVYSTREAEEKGGRQ